MYGKYYHSMTFREAEVFVETMKNFRKKFDLTQRELAELMGVTYRCIQYIESGTHIPYKSTLKSFRRVEREYRRAIGG
jgi:predicted transcriptional regulator